MIKHSQGQLAESTKRALNEEGIPHPTNPGLIWHGGVDGAWMTTSGSYWPHPEPPPKFTPQQLWDDAARRIDRGGKVGGGGGGGAGGGGGGGWTRWLRRLGRYLRGAGGAGPSVMDLQKIIDENPPWPCYPGPPCYPEQEPEPEPTEWRGLDDTGGPLP